MRPYDYPMDIHFLYIYTLFDKLKQKISDIKFGWTIGVKLRQPRQLWFWGPTKFA